mmetsp:Transcript_152802/g.292664  ORF Transcript_152802/g.292664 Transcript_152802/m.292664 type:complete len:273 (+) Transcript_152802:154-972(+)
MPLGKGFWYGLEGLLEQNAELRAPDNSSVTVLPLARILLQHAPVIVPLAPTCKEKSRKVLQDQVEDTPNLARQNARLFSSIHYAHGVAHSHEVVLNNWLLQDMYPWLGHLQKHILHHNLCHGLRHLKAAGPYPGKNRQNMSLVYSHDASNEIAHSAEHAEAYGCIKSKAKSSNCSPALFTFPWILGNGSIFHFKKFVLCILYGSLHILIEQDVEVRNVDGQDILGVRHWSVTLLRHSLCHHGSQSILLAQGKECHEILKLKLTTSVSMAHCQ